MTRGGGVMLGRLHNWLLGWIIDRLFLRRDQARRIAEHNEQWP
jgi:hypothetical protein